MSDSKLTGLDALAEKLEEIEASETASQEPVETIDISEEESQLEEIIEEPKREEIVETKNENKDKDEEVKSEIEASTTDSEGETEESKENEYSPNYQYKFQDEMHDFDERVKSAIKSNEDEEFFRDLYTKSRGMDMYKGRFEESEKSLSENKEKYTSLETKSNNSDITINHFAKLLEGIHNGNIESFNEILSLSNATPQALQSIGMALADHLDNPQNYNSLMNDNRVNLEKQRQEERSSSLEQEQMKLAQERTEFEVSKALSNPEINELVEYVDSTWGKGTFKERVWKAGETRQAKNQKVGFEEIPNLVAEVAEWFSKARPSQESNTVNKEETKAPVQTRIVNNPTSSLPNVRGDRGVPVKSNYVKGTGLDGLASRYKEITGEDDL